MLNRRTTRRRRSSTQEALTQGCYDINKLRKIGRIYGIEFFLVLHFGMYILFILAAVSAVDGCGCGRGCYYTSGSACARCCSGFVKKRSLPPPVLPNLSDNENEPMTYLRVSGPPIILSRPSRPRLLAVLPLRRRLYDKSDECRCSLRCILGAQCSDCCLKKFGRNLIGAIPQRKRSVAGAPSHDYRMAEEVLGRLIRI